MSGCVGEKFAKCKTAYLFPQEFFCRSGLPGEEVKNFKCPLTLKFLNDVQEIAKVGGLEGYLLFPRIEEPPGGGKGVQKVLGGKGAQKVLGGKGVQKV